MFRDASPPYSMIPSMRILCRVSLAFLAFVAVPGAIRAQPATVILVRHAEKASQTEADPILSDAGTQRARDLAVALVDARVGSIITTQYQRTRLTASDVGAATKLAPIIVTAGGATHVADVAAAIMGRPTGSVVLVVGHSNTVTAIVAALGGPRFPNLCDSQYSQVFILGMNGANPPTLIRARYGAADPVDPTCTNTMRVP